MIIRPAKALLGQVDLPGDKSISHRAAMLGALALGETRITNFAASADCSSTLDCLEGLGVQIRREGGDVVIDGAGKGSFTEPSAPLDCGNSGTTMRLLSGILAGQPFRSTLTGDDSLRSRPMMRVIEPLERMGAEIASADGRAPLNVHGRQPLHPIVYEPPVASAQLKSCVLLAGLGAEGETTVIEKTPTRDHTERMLRYFGADVAGLEAEGAVRLTVSGDAVLEGRHVSIPGDISSAAFFLVAAAALRGSELLLPGVGLNPSRTAVIDILRRLGARIEIADLREECNEPVGDIRVKGGLNPVVDGSANKIDGRVIANLIDELPVLAVFGTQLPDGLVIRDAAELRVKESDRIAAVVSNLKLMGARVEEFHDGLRVARSDLHGAEIDSFGDHRIAMAFAIAGLFAKGETYVSGAECAAVSFPSFFDSLAKVVES